MVPFQIDTADRYILRYHLPIHFKVASSFMSREDFVDATVLLIAKHPTLDTYKAIIVDNEYFRAMLNTFILSASAAIVQTFITCLIGYGFAKFKFKGNKILFYVCCPNDDSASPDCSPFDVHEVPLFRYFWNIQLPRRRCI